jgi:hypothetical protein
LDQEEEDLTNPLKPIASRPMDSSKGIPSSEDEEDEESYTSKRYSSEEEGSESEQFVKEEDSEEDVVYVDTDSENEIKEEVEEFELGNTEIIQMIYLGNQPKIFAVLWRDTLGRSRRCNLHFSELYPDHIDILEKNRFNKAKLKQLGLI